MRATTISRNYAEALLALASKARDLDGWGAAVNGVVTAMENDARLRRFLEAPQISADEKSKVLGKAFEGKLPKTMVRFLQKLVQNRRQMLDVTLEVPLALLALRRRRQRDDADHAWRDVLGDALDDPTLAGRVAPLEQHDDPRAGVLDPVDHRHQLRLLAIVERAADLNRVALRQPNS